MREEEQMSLADKLEFERTRAVDMLRPSTNDRVSVTWVRLPLLHGAKVYEFVIDI